MVLRTSAWYDWLRAAEFDCTFNTLFQPTDTASDTNTIRTSISRFPLNKIGARICQSVLWLLYGIGDWGKAIKFQAGATDIPLLHRIQKILGSTQIPA